MFRERKSIFLVLFVYWYLYAPELNGIPFPTHLFLIPITYYYLLYDSGQLSKYISLFKYENILLIVLLFYVTILDILHGDNEYFTHVCYYIFEVLPTCYVVAAILCRNTSKESFYDILVWVGTIAAAVSMLSLLVQPINEILTSFQKSHGETDLYTGRNYGFASGYLYAYPIGQGIIGVLCLRMLKKNYKYIIPFIIILISIVVNARVGIVPIVVYFAYMIMKFNIRTVFILVLLAISLIALYNKGVFAEYQEVVDWNLSIIYDTSNYFANTDYGTYGGEYTWYDFVLENFLVFPQNAIDWIFGEQRNIFVDAKSNSDIGYINDLIYGGLILVSLITMFYARIYNRLRRIDNWDCKLFAVLFMLVYLIVNIKGEYFRPSSGNRIVLLIYTYLIYKYTFDKSDEGQISEEIVI